MQMTGNTILITGGNTGIGRAMAEAFHKAGNSVIIAGRRKAALDEVTAANPGMAALTVDMSDADSIKSFATRAIAEHPAINVVIHNAGIMQRETLKEAPDYLQTAEDTIATNLLGPIRLTAALLPHLLARENAAILTVSSGLAFVPMAATPTYSATKAAIHSYSMGLRRQLADTSVQVIEIAPPYVQTTLMGDHQASDPTAMPLDAFITEVMQILSDNPDTQEVIVERCKPLRFAAETGTMKKMFDLVSGLDH